MKDLDKRIREAEEEVADAAVEQSNEVYKQQARDRAMQLVGGFKTAAKIAQVIDTEWMRGLERFQEQREYLSLGYATMVDFLGSDDSPVTKSQYYERKALLEKEGDKLFDLFGNIGLSLRNRKLLGAGNVQIDGENAIVLGADGEEIVIPVSDTSRLLEVVTTVIDAKLDLQKKLDKQAEAIAKHDDKVRELYDEVDRVKASKVAEVGQDPHSIAMVNLNFAYRALIEAVEDMTPIEREQFAPRDFELIAARNADLAAAFGRSDWTKIAPAPAAAKTEGADDIDDFINRFLEDDDNDAELAESL